MRAGRGAMHRRVGVMLLLPWALVACGTSQAPTSGTSASMMQPGADKMHATFVAPPVDGSCVTPHGSRVVIGITSCNRHRA